MAYEIGQYWSHVSPCHLHSGYKITALSRTKFIAPGRVRHLISIATFHVRWKADTFCCILWQKYLNKNYYIELRRPARCVCAYARPRRAIFHINGASWRRDAINSYMYESNIDSSRPLTQWPRFQPLYFSAMRFDGFRDASNPHTRINNMRESIFLQAGDRFKRRRHLGTLYI